MILIYKAIVETGFFEKKVMHLVLLLGQVVLGRIIHPEFYNFIRYGNKYIKNSQRSK